jgi:hypothetical protein
MRKKSILCVCLALALAIAPASADDGSVTFGLEGVRFLYSLIPSGADVSLTYTGMQVSDLGQTKLHIKAGGGYQDSVLLRDPLTGDPTLRKADGGTGLSYNTPNFQWELGALQGLARRDDGKNLVEAFGFYRGRYDIYPNDNVGSAVFADIQGLFGTSFMGGVSYDSRVMSNHRSKRGVYMEATAEWGPGFLNATSDFWRVSGQTRGFLPVFDMPTADGNLFNVYLAGFAGVDYAAGGSVPIYVNQSFGGRNLRDSLGDCVRGYGWNAYDSSFKSVANAEVRLVGPRVWLDSIVPYLFGFVDAGYYAGFSGSASQSGASGFLASSGGGIAVDAMGFAQISLIGGLRLVDDMLYGPLDSFFWGLKFFLHF